MKVVARIGFQVRKMDAVLGSVFEVAPRIQQVAAIRSVIKSVAGWYVGGPRDHSRAVIEILNAGPARYGDIAEVCGLSGLANDGVVRRL